MNSRMLRTALTALALSAGIGLAQANTVNQVSEGFEPGAPLVDWFTGNFSNPAGQGWFQGNAGIFTAQSGTDSSYLAANFLSSGPAGVIENWVVTPQFDLFFGGTLGFWTRTEMPGFNDHLVVLFNPTGSLNVADFNQVALDINPAEQTDGYPDAWTKFSFDYLADGTGGKGRFAFVYRAANADFANYIGVDTVTIDGNVPEPGTMALALFALGVTGARLRRRRAG